MSLFERLGIRPFGIRFDPKTGQLVEIQAEAHEVPAVNEVLATTHRLGLANPVQGYSADDHAGATTSPLATDLATSGGPQSAANSVTIAQAFDRYATLQVTTSQWSDKTLRYTYAPSIKLFRELVGCPHKYRGGPIRLNTNRATISGTLPG